jgi:hypothetical protein
MAYQAPAFQAGSPGSMSLSPLLFDFAAARLALTANALQKHFACRPQLTAMQRCDGRVRVCWDIKRVRIVVPAKSFPFVNLQEGSIKQRSDDLITPLVAAA